jgi:TPP-dependent 2-oxoacid decarboxylase
MTTTSQIKIGECLIRQLSHYGIRHVFGIPGDSILGLYGMLERCEQVCLINTCNEQGTGFAADAYARVNGLGAVCVAYGAGILPTADKYTHGYSILDVNVGRDAQALSRLRLPEMP